MDVKETARRRVESAWACVNVLCPDVPEQEKKAICQKVLDVCRREHKPQIRITPAQVQEIIWRHIQCVNRYCSVVLFSQQIADELNEFFDPKGGQ